jgi:hypothetical protein
MIPVGPRTSVADRPNLRRTRRLRVLQQAKIVCGAETMIHCEVRDISVGGAKIAIKQHVPLPERFELFICAHDLRVHRARIRWRQGDFLGVSFGADETEDAPLALPPPHQFAAHAYPALVRSNSGVGTQPQHSRHSNGDRLQLPAPSDPTVAASARIVPASVRTGPYGQARRRLKSRRTTV